MVLQYMAYSGVHGITFSRSQEHPKGGAKSHKSLITRLRNPHITYYAACHTTYCAKQRLRLKQTPPVSKIYAHPGQEGLDARFRDQRPVDLHPFSKARDVGGHEQSRLQAPQLKRSRHLERYGALFCSG